MLCNVVQYSVGLSGVGWYNVGQGPVFSVVWGSVELCNVVQCSVGLCCGMV